MHAFWLVGGILILILVQKLFDKRKAATATGKSDSASSSATQVHDSTSSSFPSSGWDYEVFLNFRGEDTRTNFTDHLYNALVNCGIHTFRDNEELRIGENIDPALRSAIHQSKIAIPIFSKNFASSKWCLRELAEIVECMKLEGQRKITVMPVFHHVDPSEVRHQIGCYEKAFQNHQKKFEQETEGWKKALKQVADLKGWDLKNIVNGHEGKLIQLIVKEVWNELRKSPLIVSDNLVGIHSHIEEMKKLLNVGSDDIRIVGIHGLGGIGKTTIARCVYYTIHHHFEGCSFLADARETFQTRGLVHLQCQLVINILNLENPNITSVDQGISMIKQRLSNRKVLIVVDDVDENIDLNVIIGNCDWFGGGSRIIITTRDRSILDVFGVDNTYEPNEMDSNQSLLLFSKHAFKRDQPPEQYLDLSKDMIKTAGGLPLALEVLGSFLVGKGELAWKDTVKKLKKIPNRKVLGKLRISYDGLDRVEKKMFLDIACFFIGMDKNIACYIWDGCGFFPEIGIEVLHQKSLVKIGEKNELRMHDQLRDLGREIVCQENPSNPGERSRLWLPQEVLDVLNTQKGTNKVEGLCIDFKFHQLGQPLTSEGFASGPDWQRFCSVFFLFFLFREQFRNRNGDWVTRSVSSNSRNRPGLNELKKRNSWSKSDLLQLFRNCNKTKRRKDACGGKMILKISHTKKNPNRKFLKCPVNGEHERCFIWLDELQRISTVSSTSFMTDGASNNGRNKEIGNYQELHRVLLYHLLGLFIFLLIWVFLLTCYVVYITSVKLG